MELTGDSPDKTDHLARDCSGDDNWLLARGDKTTIPSAQTHLSLPGDIPDVLRQTFDAIVQLSAYPCLHPIGPGSLNQRPPSLTVASLRDAASS